MPINDNGYNRRYIYNFINECFNYLDINLVTSNWLYKWLSLT